MSKLLDYARPPPAPRGTAPAIIPALIIAGLEQVLVFLLYTPVLDGGRLARHCAMLLIGFWLGVLILIRYRRRNPSLLDLAIIVFGYPLLVCLAVAVLKIWA